MSTVNPFDNPEAYRTMVVGPVKLPGYLLAIDGADIEYQWDGGKPVGKGGASANFKGRKAAEGIKVTCELTTAAHFVELDLARKALRIADGDKAVSHDVRNAIFNNQGINTLGVKKIGQEKWNAGRWTVDFEFRENGPPKQAGTGGPAGTKAATGKADSADQPKFVEPPMQTKADQELDELLKKAKAA